MGFRNPISTATAIDTGRGLADPGVRLFQDLGNPSVPRGVAEWRTGLMDRNAQVFLSGGSGNSAFVIDGGATSGKNAPSLELDVQDAPTSGKWSVARIVADFLALPGDSLDLAVTYGAGVTAYTDTSGWNGLRCWKRSGVVTVAGAIRLTGTVANNGVIATLPAGFAPPEKLQRNIDNSTAISVTVLTDRTIILSPSQAAGFVCSFSFTYAVLS